MATAHRKGGDHGCGRAPHILVWMCVSLVGLALVYPSGMLVDRYGRKPVIVPATLVAGASLTLFLFAPSYTWFVAGCLVWGVAVGLVTDLFGVETALAVAAALLVIVGLSFARFAPETYR